MYVLCVASTLFNDMSLEDMRLRRDLRSDVTYRSEFKKAYKAKVSEEISQKTEALIQARLRKRNTLRELGKTLVTSEAEPNQNVDSNDSYEHTGNDSSYIATDSGTRHVLTLDKFFERPTLIDDFSYDVNTVRVTSIEPFDLWSSDPTIRGKLAHYAFIRGDLKVKITTSSTRFHFGAMLVSFQPYFDANPILQSLLEFYQENPFSRGLLNNYLSQSPERHVIKFGKDNTIEMTLPMIMPKKAAKLFNKDGSLITNAVSFEELVPLGTLVFSSINELSAANDDEQSPVRVQTYAWMENIELGPTTATDINITAEAAPIDQHIEKGKTWRDSVNNNETLGKVADLAQSYVSDEYSDAGPASKIASAVSNIAEKASSIPVIGVAARATSMAASAGAKVLKFFGFSKPSQLEPLVFMKNLPYSNGALLEGKDTAYKLTADPKQELSIQPLGGEMNIDPMAIKFMTGRESYFHSFNWTGTDTPRVDTIAMFPVMPMYDTQALSGTEDQVHQLTALGYAALPFTHWRGTISLRFEVIASSFHRGKLMFIYEPNSYGLSLIESGVTDLNQQYIYYLDIEEDRDLTIDCGFVHDKLFANVYDLSDVDFYTAYREHFYTNGSIPVYQSLANSGQSIGNVYVRPFTTLTSPSSNGANDVKINCYVYSNDIEFAVPVDMSVFEVGRRISSEASPVAPDGATQKDVASNTRTSSITSLINKVKPTNDNVYSYHFGEKIESFRSLLKRDEGLASFSNGVSSSGISCYNVPVYPCAFTNGLPYYGNVSDNIDTNFNNNQARFTLFDHLRYAFLFCKGGYRYRIYETNTNQYFGNVCVDRVLLNGKDDQFVYLNTVAQQNLLPRLSGSVVYNTHTNTGVEFEVPYYSDNLFELSCLPYSEVVDSTNGTFTKARPGAKVTYEHTRESHTYTTYIVGSAAEDFTFFRFQGAGYYVRLSGL
jgi:hypothetical protein